MNVIIFPGGQTTVRPTEVHAVFHRAQREGKRSIRGDSGTFASAGALPSIAVWLGHHGGTLTNSVSLSGPVLGVIETTGSWPRRQAAGTEVRPE